MTLIRRQSFAYEHEKNGERDYAKGGGGETREREGGKGDGLRSICDDHPERWSGVDVGRLGMSQHALDVSAHCRSLSLSSFRAAQVGDGATFSFWCADPQPPGQPVRRRRDYRKTEQLNFGRNELRSERARPVRRGSTSLFLRRSAGPFIGRVAPSVASFPPVRARHLPSKRK
uniref:Uncharacterized protein n=1 Tax=Plectus sambesii TaxID=2011161 RepID=A0A914VU17_9BILA